MPVTLSPVTQFPCVVMASSSTKEETPKHDSEKEEETLAEPLKSEMDEDNCVYFKISKLDINKPEIVKLLVDAIRDKKDEPENVSSKVTSSDAPDQMPSQTQTQITLAPPIINEVVIENKPPVQHVQPVAFVPPPAQPVVQTYYVSQPMPSTDVVIPGSSGFVFFELPSNNLDREYQ